MIKFLVPMDFSKEALLALDWTVKWANKIAGSQIYLLTVGPVGQDEPKTESIRAQLQKEIAGLRQQLPDPIDLFGFYRTGKVPEEVRDFCVAEGIDMVVMTTRGRFGKAIQLEGSTTEETVRLVQCPIMVLHFNQATLEDVKKRFEGFLPRKNNPPAL